MYRFDYTIDNINGTIESPTPITRWNFPPLPTSAILNILHRDYLGAYADNPVISVVVFFNILAEDGEVVFNGDLRYPLTGADAVRLQLALSLTQAGIPKHFHPKFD